MLGTKDVELKDKRINYEEVLMGSRRTSAHCPPTESSKRRFPVLVLLID